MPQQVTRTVIVKSDPLTIYNLWADFENFPHFMNYVKAVEKLDEKRSEWEVEGPLGMSVKWQAEMTRSEPGRRIGWNSKDHDGTITTSGQVSFAGLPNDETEVTVLLQYDAPGGKLGDVAAQLFSNPEKRLEEDLRNFKQFVEGQNGSVVH